ncbi:MAG: GNAT family N-acetyltransferase [Chloroflexi bacterium]|nr:GNAT family N-acetyltransferase [Chloroflexota bacterium]
MRLTTLTPDDLPNLTALCVRCLNYEVVSPELLRYTLLQTDDGEPDVALGLSCDGRLVAVAVGSINEAQGDFQGYIKAVLTDPDYRRRGLGKLLLLELEERLRDRGVLSISIRACRRYLLPGVDVRYSEALCLFDRLGYQRSGTTFNLEVDLRMQRFDLENRLAHLQQGGVVVRRIGEPDQTALSAYLRATWGKGWHAEGMAVFNLGRKRIPGFIAAVGETIVGFAVYDVTRPGWFGPIGTTEAYRHTGVGGALLLCCLHDWQEQGRASGEIAAIGPLYFYVTTCGARISRTFITYRKHLDRRGG